MADEKQLLAQPPDVAAGISAIIQRSQEAFQRDLPALLKARGKAAEWVAYCGDERIAVGPSKTQLYQECLRRGLERGTFIVRHIGPEGPREVEHRLNVYESHGNENTG